eukprot:3084973-Amphidinium_carterae.1
MIEGFSAVAPPVTGRAQQLPKGVDMCLEHQNLSRPADGHFGCTCRKQFGGSGLSGQSSCRIAGRAECSFQPPLP